ncbi:MAG: asparagine synthetase B, partial [Blastocatellia bacterium]|nr:asparagine synthetase B [Blastocatellia bacterium]
VAGLIPDKIIYRPKQGFDVPIRRRLNREMKEMVNDLLASPLARERGYFNPKSVASLLQEHNRGARDHAHSLWALLMLEVWRRILIDHGPAASGASVKVGARSVI